MRLLAIDGIVWRAVAACRARRWAKPCRVMPLPRALRKRWSWPVTGRTASQSRSAERVSCHNGSTRSRRPFGHAHGIEVRPCEVCAHQPDQLRDSEAGGVGQIAASPDPARRRRSVGSGAIEQGPQLITFQRFDQRFIAALHRDRVHLVREVETGRCAILEVAEE